MTYAMTKINIKFIKNLKLKIELLMIIKFDVAKKIL